MSDRITEIENRLNAATPGPWETMKSGLLGTRVVAVDGEWDALVPDEFVTLVTPSLRKPADAEFIAHSPSDVVYLLTELRKRDEVIAKLSEWAGRSKSAYYDEAQDDVVQIIRPVLAAAKGGSA